MSSRQHFFDLDLHQVVNGWLCATLFVVMFAWVGLFYYLDKGDALATSEVASYAHTSTEAGGY